MRLWLQALPQRPVELQHYLQRAVKHTARKDCDLPDNMDTFKRQDQRPCRSVRKVL